MANVSTVYDSQERMLYLCKSIVKHMRSILAIKDLIEADDLYGAAQVWDELTDSEQKSIWAAPSKGGPFTTREREIIRNEIGAILRNEKQASPL